MTRHLTTLAAALTLIVAAGCDSHAYDPHSSNAGLTAYANQNQYPMDMKAGPSDSIVYSIADDGTIRLNNTGDRTLADVQVWVNKSYVLEVSSLPAHDYKDFAPENFFNSSGQTLKSEKVSQSWTVQIRDSGQLMTAKGPIKM